MLAVFFQQDTKPSLTDFHSAARIIGFQQLTTSSVLSPGSWTMLVYSGEISGVQIEMAFGILGTCISHQLNFLVCLYRLNTKRTYPREKYQRPIQTKMCTVVYLLIFS